MAKRIGLRPRLTGLPFVVWLSKRRARDDHNVLVEISDTEQYDPDTTSAFLIEPSIILVRGDEDSMTVNALASFVLRNQDLIEDFWYERITDPGSLSKLIRKMPENHYA